MERITYRKTLDVHKNGIQFLLQGFETADKMSRVIEVSLMASGDTIDFPLERVSAWMYVTSPGADEPDIQGCTIVDNKVVYEVMPITTEGITEMKLKLIETDAKGMKSVLASPKFAVEVTESGMNDDGEELKAKFTDIESLIGLAKRAYDNRLDRIELSSDCTFYAYYSDGTVMYKTDILKKLFLNGNVELSASYAHGGTGVRVGEDTDNSMYYSNVSKSEALNAKSIMEDSKEVLEEVKLHGVYTAFSVDFNTGEVEYVSPSFKFKVNKETGELDAEGQAYTFSEEIYRVIAEWLANNGVVLKDLEDISKDHTLRIGALEETSTTNTEHIAKHKQDIETLKTRVTPIEKGGTGAKTAKEARKNLGVSKESTLASYLAFVGNINEDMVAAAFGKNNEDEIVGVGKALAMYAKYKSESANVDYLNDYDKFSDIVLNHKADLTNTKTLFDFIKSSPYAYDKLVNTNTGLPDIVLYDRGITEYLDIPNATIYNFVKDEDEIYDGKNFSYSLDTNSNISIRKAVSNTVDLTKAFQYTLPLLKDLPKLSGYRYLNVKLSDDEESYVYIGTGDFSVTLGGIETTMYQCDEMLTWTEPDISLTGSLYKKDIFDNYAINPNSQEVAISIYLMSFSKKADDSRNRSAELDIHIDKIWISES